MRCLESRLRSVCRGAEFRGPGEREGWKGDVDDCGAAGE